jgi:ATP-dependent Lon protease
MEATPESKDLVIVSEILPDKLTVIPIEPRPIFPNIMLPMALNGSRYVELIKRVWEEEQRLLGVALVHREDKEDYFHSELHPVGTILKLYKVNIVNDETVQILVQGLQRFTQVRPLPFEQFQRWEVRYHYDPQGNPSEEQKAYAMAIMSTVKELMRANPLLQDSLKMMLSQMTYDNSVVLMDVVTALLSSEPETLQDLLATFDLTARSEKLLLLLKQELEVVNLQEKIQKQMQEKVSKQQKEFFLREQLKAIKKELGLEKDGKTAEIEKFEERLKDLVLTEEAAKVIHEELDKMRMMESQSPEYNVTRNYLDHLTSLPWGKLSADNLNIKKARKILNDQHYGLDDVKQRILEFISTSAKRGRLGGSIICLVGPPGVGKTSIGKSIAAALNRQFYRFSVGGMRDEAEIKGHRRTYIGAMPGKLVQALKRTGTANPVIMLDEIDKVGKSYQGDPASALLEVLDPEQNVDFLDHYLDVRFDLSNVVFVTTANQLDTIPGPLLDRMEIIRLGGYVLEEKVQIAKRYLIPRQLEQHGLTPEEAQFTDQALQQIIDRYAREAGVRNLENQIKRILREITLEQVEKKVGNVKITAKNVEKYLGKPRFTAEELYDKPLPGVTLGLAWTSMGGAVLHIEARALPAKAGGFRQTGQLGEVMRESAEIAYSYLRSVCADEKGKNFFDKHFIHLHVPEGATPKDGPSAGITMALALYSLAHNRPLPRRIAMTGELSLTGKVWPIGGVREKVIAAKRVKVHELIFPKANQKDFEELPEYIRKGMSVHFVSYFDEVLDIVYGR